MSQWGTRRDVKERFGIPQLRLDCWVKTGFVRKAPLGKRQCSRALFSFDDINRVVEDLAAGREPQKTETGGVPC